MSNPKVTARSVSESFSLCEVPVDVDLSVEYPFGSEDAALAALDEHAARVRAQILQTKGGSDV